MMALLRLNTDIPNDVFPSGCRQEIKSGEGMRVKAGKGRGRKWGKEVERELWEGAAGRGEACERIGFHRE